MTQLLFRDDPYLKSCPAKVVAAREIGPLAVVRIRSEGRRNKRVTLAFAP